ncbi:MAG: N-acetylmuramoyl-L-alanine amidase [Actinomycetota bacterium]|nr:N-acetylmuramoyl-L-alanine amidase [Actinomycetota bacterium]
MNGLIRPGDRSGQVADIQARLRSLGLDVLDPPGVFGDSTRTAVRAFQQRRGLLVDGIVGPQTWGGLVEASWRLGDRIVYLKSPPMRGDDVGALQRRLNALGFDAGKEDGIFGPDTDAAVRAFQKEYGVSEDGMFGPISHAALNGLRADRDATARPLREELARQKHAGIGTAVIVLDPGHGPGDPGETARDAPVVEDDVCWDLATRIASHLIDAGAKVYLTRARGEAPSASDRAARANEMGADLFISLHLNAHQEASAEGCSAFYFEGSRAGEALAERIQERLVQLGLNDCRTHARSYALLKETRMPAVLVEPVFITNPNEARMLEDPEFIETLAQTIALGTLNYFVPDPAGTPS